MNTNVGLEFFLYKYNIGMFRVVSASTYSGLGITTVSGFGNFICNPADSTWLPTKHKIITIYYSNQRPNYALIINIDFLAQNNNNTIGFRS